jgi:SAM-dependent methyltransferase
MSTQSHRQSSGCPGTDPAILREQAYADDALLNVRRRTHQLYTVNPVDFGRWTLEQLSLKGDEVVLDVGCGPGDLLHEMARRSARWRALVGFDFSPGMAAHAARGANGLPVHFFAGDAQALPFAARLFDVVMARHMLYHVPDIGLAVAEAARVLGPGGHFLALTNSAHSMPEYAHIRAMAAERFDIMHRPGGIVSRFSLENGVGFLRPHFQHVEVRTLPGLLRFPTAQPLMDYFASHASLDMGPDHTPQEWQAVLDFVRSEVEAVIRKQGHFDITKITGAIVGIKGD